MGETLADPVEARIAARLAALRLAHALSLDDLAARTGLSRATLSRIERGETSPTAAMLGRLCAAFGWTLSRLMADAETPPAGLLPAAEQPEWSDPETGFRRRAISPPAPGLRIELVEAELPPDAAIAYPAPPIAGMEQHLHLVAGVLDFTHGPDTWRLAAGDCLRLRLTSPTRLAAPGPAPARYLIAIAAP
jgi:transcriptional regulator with XRE-family HTH domain